MSKLHLRNVVFPAVLLSCSIFSSLTLPFVLSDSNPVSVKLPPFFEGEIQPIFTSDNKTFTIRYIGAAIVLSVGTGLLTVEVLRRAQRQTQKQVSMIPPEEELTSEALSETTPPTPVFDMDSFTPLPALVEEFASAANSEANTAATETNQSSVAVLEEQGETCQINW